MTDHPEVIPTDKSSTATLLTSPSLMESFCAKAHHGAIRIGHALFLIRDYLFPALFIVLLCTTWPRFLFGSERADRWMDLLGLMVATLGQGCRALAIGSAANIRRGGREKRVAARNLISSGFFAHSRNPLYLGNILIFSGLTLIANSYGWYFIALPVTVSVYWALMLAEEDFLAQKFGEPYVLYRQAVNRFVPKLGGLRASLRACHFDWWRILHKEYGVACSWLSMVLGLLIWERWEHFGYAARYSEIQALALVFPFLGLGYVVLQLLKRRNSILTRA